MLNNILFKLKSVWIYVLVIFLLLIILAMVIIFLILGPSDFIGEFFELFGSSQNKTWVLLVAGSKGWSNYRHQADIAHAYQTLLNNGIPFDQIIVMMTDDVAYNVKNPYPGELFNNPNSSDVYQGLKIDYSGKDVNSVNFLRVLSGNQENMKNIGSGRVINSKHSDNIFVNFVGHGTTGILVFPENYLYADELNIVLTSMFNNRKFKNMLLYIESCRAGSIFDGILSETSNIFAVTASGPRESSWATYCIDEDETLTNVLCLGDEFSVTWIEDQTNIGVSYPLQVKERVEKRTVLNHFNYIRTRVKLSNVMPYGDFRVGQDKLSTFIGKSPEVYPKYLNNNDKNNNISSKRYNTIVNSHKKSNILIKHFLLNKHNGRNATKQWIKRDNNYYNNTMRKIMDKVLNAIIQDVIKQYPSIISDINELKQLPSNLPLKVFPCYRQSLNHITNNCFFMPKNIYSLSIVHIYFNLCTRIIDDGKWESEKFDAVFEKIVHTVCSKNSSLFSNLQRIIDIY